MTTADRQPPAAGDGEQGQANPIAALSDDECREVLLRQRLCVLATTDGEQPYAIPMFYGYDGEELYLGVSEGKKSRVLDTNPLLCITVTEVGPGDRWCSVQLIGRAAWVTEAEHRTRAIGVLMAHNRKFRTPDDERSAPRRRHGGGRMLQVVDARMTGRAVR